MGEEMLFEMPAGFPRPVASAASVEEAADALRRAWELGMGPLDDLVDIMEARGIKISVAAPESFESLMLHTDTGQPVIAVSPRPA